MSARWILLEKGVSEEEEGVVSSQEAQTESSGVSESETLLRSLRRCSVVRRWGAVGAESSMR